jgi:hypothetical protein
LGDGQAPKAEGFLVSLDSFSAEDILKADQAGVDYLLSVNPETLTGS